MRTERWTYVTYGGGERELYDNESDPHQLRNLAGGPRYRHVEDELHAKLVELRADRRTVGPGRGGVSAILDPSATASAPSTRSR